MTKEIICQGEKRSLMCGSGKVLDISSANYGRYSMFSRCGWSLTNECITPKSLEIVRGMCHNKISCTVQASDNVFGGYCSHSSRYLRIIHECVQRPTTTTHSEDHHDVFSSTHASVTSDQETMESGFVDLIVIGCAVAIFVLLLMAFCVTKRKTWSASGRQTNTRNKSQGTGMGGEDTACELHEKTAEVTPESHTTEDPSQLRREETYTLFSDNEVETSHCRHADIPEEQSGDAAYTLYGDTETVSNEQEHHLYVNTTMSFYETIADGDASHHAERRIPQKNMMQRDTSMEGNVYEYA